MKLELCDISCGYQNETPLLRHVGLTAESGEICCILGPNGVGKTTLFKTILNILPPLAGKVCIDGADIQRWRPGKLASAMAYVAQSHNAAMPYRVREVAMMGRMGRMRLTGRPSEADYRIVEQALEDVGIRHLRDALYTEISGGERQLLMIARALAQQPGILLMDEPTANLDYGNTVRVLSCIRALADRGLCVLFSSHLPEQPFSAGPRRRCCCGTGGRCGAARSKS